MRNALYGLLLFLLWFLFCRGVWVGSYLKVCDKVETGKKMGTISKTLSLQDGVSYPLDKYEEFNFPSNGLKPMLSDNNKQFIDEALAYMKRNPDKKLKITGYYLASEEGKKSGVYENLGLARAAQIRDVLAAKGIPQDRFALDYAIANGTALNAPIDFEAIGADHAPASYSFMDMTFSDANFEFGKQTFIPTEQFKIYADSLVQFADANPNATLTIVGHTDNVGDEKQNQILGRARARQVREYLQKAKGIRLPIVIDSKGETSPIASNDIDEGRAKNRRVNCTLKK